MAEATAAHQTGDSFEYSEPRLISTADSCLDGRDSGEKPGAFQGLVERARDGWAVLAPV